MTHMRYKHVHVENIQWREKYGTVSDNMYLGRDLEAKLGRTVLKEP